MTHQLTTKRLYTLLSFTGILALMVSLSACSSQTSTEPTPSVSASSADSFAIVANEGIENPELPERPAAMDNYDEDGAMAAAEYFLQLSLYGFVTGNWNEYDALSSSDCSFCQSYREARETNRNPSIKNNMPEMKIKDAYAWKYEENTEQIRVNLIAERYGYTATKANGAIINQAGEAAALAFLFDFKDDWQIVDVIPFEIEKYYEDVKRHDND